MDHWRKLFYLFLFLLFVNILLLKSNLTAPGVEVENLKEKVWDKDQVKNEKGVTKEGKLNIWETIKREI